MATKPNHRIEQINAAAPALRTYRRAINGENDGQQIKQSTYVWLPAFRLAIARFVAMLALAILALAVASQIYDMSHYSESQWICLAILTALVFSAESFARHGKSALNEWRYLVTPTEIDRELLEWLLDSVNKPEADQPEPDDGIEMIETDYLISIGDFDISFDEARYFVINEETHFTRGQFQHISDREYKNFTSTLSVHGYAEERSHRNWHWTDEGIRWLKSMIRYSPHAPHKQRGGVRRTRVTPPPPRTPPRGN